MRRMRTEAPVHRRKSSTVAATLDAATADPRPLHRIAAHSHSQRSQREPRRVTFRNADTRRSTSTNRQPVAAKAKAKPMTKRTNANRREPVCRYLNRSPFAFLSLHLPLRMPASPCHTPSPRTQSESPRPRVAWRPETHRRRPRTQCRARRPRGAQCGTRRRRRAAARARRRTRTRLRAGGGGGGGGGSIRGRQRS